VYEVYVAAGGSNQIVRFGLDTATGELAPRPPVELPGSIGPLAVSPDQRRLYAGLRNTKAVASFTIDPAAGDLKPIAVNNVVANPVYLSIDPANRHLFTADYGANLAANYAINPDGSLIPQPITKLDMPKNPHSILTDSTGRYVFVPSCGTDQVMQLKLERDGRMTANNPPSVASRPVDGPRHLIFHPTRRFLYVVNEKSSSVTGYRYDPATGTLAALQTLPTLPEGFTGKNTCADIHVTPDGRYLYASNRGHNSLAAYSINAANGELTPLGQFETEAVPRDFEIDPSGRFIVAAGQNSGKVAVHRIERDGTLTRLASHDAGKGPAWVLILNLNRSGD
jgi:6-phosphogluconolactonase